MSDVLSRWNWSENGMVQEDNGPFYLCDDYAALRADLTMKNEENNSLLAQMVTLRAENERLRQLFEQEVNRFDLAETHIADLTAQLAAIDHRWSRKDIDELEGQLAAMTQERDERNRHLNMIADLLEGKYIPHIAFETHPHAHNLRMLLSTHKQQLAERDAHILALAQEGLTAGDTIARLEEMNANVVMERAEFLLDKTTLQARITTLEAALKSRRQTVVASLAVEVLADNAVKCAIERAALVEIEFMDAALKAH